MNVERMNRIDEDIAKLDKMIRVVNSHVSNDANEATQSHKFNRKEYKSAKLDRIKEENVKLKEEIYKLETEVSALNATSLSKENRLQNVLKTQKDLERTLSRKVSELKNLLGETKKYKETAFNRIEVLEEKCEKLNKKVMVQSQELKTVKERYSILKKKLCGEKKDEIDQKIARSTSTTEMCDKEIQVDDNFLINIDTTIEDLFFLPTPPSPKKVQILSL